MNFSQDVLHGVLLVRAGGSFTLKYVSLFEAYLRGALEALLSLKNRSAGAVVDLQNVSGGTEKSLKALASVLGAVKKDLLSIELLVYCPDKGLRDRLVGAEIVLELFERKNEAICRLGRLVS